MSKRQAILQPVKEVRAEVRGVLTGFADFIRTYNVAALAIGVVIGNAVNDLVKNLVEGLITPFINLISPQQELSTYSVKVGQSVFKIGPVINSVINFVIIAFIVYVAVKLLMKEAKKDEDEKVDPEQQGAAAAQ